MHQSAAQNVTPAHGRVCVVDPAAKDYQTWEPWARERGLWLKIVSSSEEALRLARTESIDLWVVNAELPGLSGCELCEMLKARRTAAAVYLVAERYSPAIELRAWRAGATLFGCKGGHDQWLSDWWQTRSRVERSGIAGIRRGHSQSRACC